jgi:hypothetical protein
MEPKYNVSEIPIEEVQTGMTLVVERGGQQRLFQVENKKFKFKAGETPMFTVETEPVDGGEPWAIEGPAGTVLRRITKA